MSVFPCDVHGQRVPGALSGLYLSVMHDQTWFGRRLRLCRADLDSFRADHERSIPLIGSDNLECLDQVCGSCGGRFVGNSDRAAVVCYIYPKGEEPEERYANWCRRCAINLKDGLGLTPRA